MMKWKANGLRSMVLLDISNGECTVRSKHPKDKLHDEQILYLTGQEAPGVNNMDWRICETYMHKAGMPWLGSRTVKRSVKEYVRVCTIPTLRLWLWLWGRIRDSESEATVRVPRSGPSGTTKLKATYERTNPIFHLSSPSPRLPSYYWVLSVTISH